jgi:hypothetical protein
MREERTWQNELKWWISAVALLLAVLAPFSAIDGIYRAIHETGSGVDRIGSAIGWTLILPLGTAQFLWPFFLAAALSFRLLVPTFAGLRPHVAAALVTIPAVAWGAWLQTADRLVMLELSAVALVWALLMPLPVKNILVRGPVIGGIVVGLALSTFAVQYDGLLYAIIWCSWRMYRDHFEEAAVTSICAALLPAALALHDLPAVVSTPQSVYTAIEILILLGISIGGMLLAQLGPEPGDDAPEDEAEEQP